MPDKPRTPYTLRFDGETWIAHAVAFDLVAADGDKDAAIRQLKMCLIAQIGWGVKRGHTPRTFYFAAPPKGDSNV